MDGFECCDQLASTLSQVFSAAASTHPAQLKGTYCIRMKIIYCLCFDEPLRVSFPVTHTLLFQIVGYSAELHFFLFLRNLNIIIVCAASGVVDAALFAQLLQPLLDLVAQTSPVAENTAQGTYIYRDSANCARTN